jgi:hypothetical protein
MLTLPLAATKTSDKVLGIFCDYFSGRGSFHISKEGFMSCIWQLRIRVT